MPSSSLVWLTNRIGILVHFHRSATLMTSLDWDRFSVRSYSFGSMYVGIAISVEAGAVCFDHSSTTESVKRHSPSKAPARSTTATHALLAARFPPAGQSSAYGVGARRAGRPFRSHPAGWSESHRVDPWSLSPRQSPIDRPECLSPVRHSIYLPCRGEVIKDMTDETQCSTNRESHSHPSEEERQ
jgi:hypothetical protein